MRFISIIFIFLLSFHSSIVKSNVDSLKTELQNSKQDTIKVKLLIQLWEATAYSDMEEAAEYSEKALKLSRKLSYRRGEVESLHRIAVLYNNMGNYDSAVIYYQKSLDIAHELNLLSLEANVLMDLGIVYYSQGIYADANSWAEQSLKKYSELNDEEGVAAVLSLLGNINFYSGNYDEAQKYHLQSVKIFEKGNDEIRLADALVYLASNYQALDKSEKALKNLYRAGEIYKRHNDQFFLAQALNNIGFIHNNLGEKDSARLYYEQGIEQSLLSNNQTMLNLGYMNMGNIYKAQNDVKKAFEYFYKSLELAKKLNDKVTLSDTYNNLGILFAQQNNHNKALSYYDTAQLVAHEVGSKDNLQSIYENLSELHESIENYPKALEYYKMHTVYRDSMFNEDKTHKIEEMEARYEKEKKEKEIAIQKTEIELLSKDLKIQSIKRDGLLIGFICSIVAGIYIFFSLRQKMNRNKLLREQEKTLEQEKLHVAQLERDQYEKELSFKKNELTTHALHMIQKNELLDTLKSNINELEKNQQNVNGYGKLRRIINGSVQIEKEWVNFNRHFEQVHHGFYSKLKNEHQSLTGNDLRLSAMLRMNLSSKEVASIMNVSPESVKKARYRLRKKLQLENEADLHTYMMNV